MEFIDGETVAAVIKRREPLTLARKLRFNAAALRRRLCRAQCGIVHRDIKPPKLWLSGRGRLKILDFGIAKMVDSGMYTLTGAFIGSCNYVSPEQVSGRSTLDKRSDTFSIGAVFDELLSTARRSPAYPGVLHKILHQPPETLASTGVPADAGLDVAAIEANSADRLSGIAKDPDSDIRISARR